MRLGILTQVCPQDDWQHDIWATPVCHQMKVGVTSGVWVKKKWHVTYGTTSSDTAAAAGMHQCAGQHCEKGWFIFVQKGSHPRGRTLNNDRPQSRDYHCAPNNMCLFYWNSCCARCQEWHLWKYSVKDKFVKMAASGRLSIQCQHLMSLQQIW